MKKLFLIGLLALAALAAWLLAAWKSAPPTLAFTEVKRETLTSTLETNGKVEPLHWVEVRAERPGIIDRVAITPGRQVVRGAVIAELSSNQARADLESAEARIAAARAQFDVIESGGQASQRTEIENALNRARFDLQTARREHAALKRLAEKNAATRQEVIDAEERVRRTELEIQSLEQKRSALVSPPDRSSAEAAMRDAQAMAQLARERLALSIVRAPMDGVVYHLPARAGGYVNPGDLIAAIGQLDQVRVAVFVDEPELGRVRTGLPVTITWDARPGREWQGLVDRIPTKIDALGSRQVGEVICIIENPGRELLPGTNVNARIRSEVVENALTIPKETLRRLDGRTGVYALKGDAIEWRVIETGISSVTRVQVISGLRDGDAVALPTELAIQDGMPVKPEMVP